MATELELKALVPDPGALRSALRAAGAACTFRGLLHDRRLDRRGVLLGRDEVLRVRRWVGEDGHEAAQVAWKGPTGTSPDGYKHREELECGVAEGGTLLAILGRLGYEVTHAIDRAVEVYRLDDTVARIEWYPRMDVLVEVEGPPPGIERVIAVAGIPRADYTAEALPAFVTRYEARTGQPAILAVDALGPDRPAWEVR